MSRPAARDKLSTTAPVDVRPWVARRAIEVPADTGRCATCHRVVSFLVLDNRDMKWRCAACATPAAETLAPEITAETAPG